MTDINELDIGKLDKSVRSKMNKALDSTAKNWHINGLKAFDL